MTVILSGQEVGAKLTAKFPDAIVDSSDFAAIVKPEFLLDILAFLKNTPAESFDFLNDITAVDYLDYFEVVYRVSSLENNRSLVLKVRCYDREKPEIPSLVSLWKGADFMEREIYDLMGITFKGHPNLKRIFLWEGFKGHPLRKDYL
jgi:NADH-quinone oxidoreductase subunit C